MRENLHFGICSSLSELASRLGKTSFFSTSNVYSSLEWWASVELMRPEIRIEYGYISHNQKVTAAIPIYFYSPGRTGDPYAADWKVDKHKWPASRAAEPWALVGGCSGFHSGFIYTSQSEAENHVQLLFRSTFAYLKEKNFNLMAPFLDLTNCRNICDSLSLQGFPAHLVNATTTLPVNFTSFDEYISLLPQQFRTIVRRDTRTILDSELRVEVMRLSECMGFLPSLWDAVEVSHGSKPNLELRCSMLNAQAKTMDNISSVFVVKDSANRVISASLYYEYNGEIHCRLVGVDYERAKPTGAYFEAMYYAPIRYAIHEKLQKVCFGIDAFTAKIIRGSELRPLFTLYVGQDLRTLDPSAAKEATSQVMNYLRSFTKNISSKSYQIPNFDQI